MGTAESARGEQLGARLGEPGAGAPGVPLARDAQPQQLPDRAQEEQLLGAALAGAASATGSAAGRLGVGQLELEPPVGRRALRRECRRARRRRARRRGAPRTRRRPTSSTAATGRPWRDRRPSPRRRGAPLDDLGALDETDRPAVERQPLEALARGRREQDEVLVVADPARHAPELPGAGQGGRGARQVGGRDPGGAVGLMVEHAALRAGDEAVSAATDVAPLGRERHVERGEGEQPALADQLREPREPAAERRLGQMGEERADPDEIEALGAGQVLRARGRDEALDAEMPALEPDRRRDDVGDDQPLGAELGGEPAGQAAVAAGEVEQAADRARAAAARRAEGEDGVGDPAAVPEVLGERRIAFAGPAGEREAEHLVVGMDGELRPYAAREAAGEEGGADRARRGRAHPVDSRGDGAGAEGAWSAIAPSASAAGTRWKRSRGKVDRT